MTVGIPESLAALTIPITDLRQYGANPRRGNVDAIAESLRINGQYRPVVVRRGTMEILAGNHTWLAAQQLGWTELAGTFVDCDDEQAKRIVLVDNRSNDVAGYDDAALLELLQSVEDLAGSGFSDADLEALMATVIEPAALTNPDDVPDPPKDPVSVLGDVWVLGKHRVVCGDATDVGAHDALLGDAKADCVWTDPPYGVNYVGKTKDSLTIENDGAEDLPDLLSGAFNAVTLAAKEGAAVYVAHPAGALSVLFGTTFIAAGWRFHQTLIWDKGSMALGHSDYHFRHEPIILGYTPGGGRRGRGGKGWYGNDSQVSVLEVPKPSRNKEHPTMKPVELIVRCLSNSAPPGGIVLDPFGGSGSTLIACHATNRVARLIELDPRYVDVICRRFQTHTGVTPVLESTGEPHDFVAANE